jgi:hypothetical protein
MSISHCSLLSFGCAFGFSPPADQRGLTALRALKVAQRRLRPEVRAKLLSVSSSRTDQTLIPDAWRFIFLDPATSGNCRIVTVAAKTSSEHPDTIEAFSAFKAENGAHSTVIPQNKLLIDSIKAFEEVRAHSKLKGVRAAEYRLVQAKGNQEPFWSLQFFGESGNPVAKFHVGAKTGTMSQCAASDK